MKLGLDESTWAYRFVCDGKRYTLIKRDQTKNGAWYLTANIRGQRIKRSLDTSIAVAAEKRAVNEIIRPARAGNWEGVAKKARNPCSSMGLVIDCYRNQCVGKLAPRTVKDNINSMRMVVRRGLGDDGIPNDKLDELPSSVLTGKLVNEFEDWMCRIAVKTKRDLGSNQRSIVSLLRQARSLFKETALPRYKEGGVRLPDTIAEFMARPVERAPQPQRLPADEALVGKTFEAAQALRTADRPAYIAFLLGLCSLRRREISLMKWEWVVARGARFCIQLPADVTKSGVARIVPIDSRVRQELEAFKVERCIGRDPDEESYVIPSPRLGQGKDGTACRLRGQCVFRRVNKWMRDQGWTTGHTLHEMRALALSLVRDGYGLDVAQSVAGHSDLRTTQQHYVGTKSVKGVEITLPMKIG